MNNGNNVVGLDDEVELEDNFPELYYEGIYFNVCNNHKDLYKWLNEYTNCDFNSSNEIDSAKKYFEIKNIMFDHGFQLSVFVDSSDNKTNDSFNNLNEELNNNPSLYKGSTGDSLNMGSNSFARFKRKYFKDFNTDYVVERNLQMVDFVLIEEDGEEDCVAIDAGLYKDHRVVIHENGFDYHVKFIFPYSDYLTVKEFDEFLLNEKDRLIFVWYNFDSCENVEC